MASLVDRSILTRRPDQTAQVRFRMMDGLRVYGLELLAGTGEDVPLLRRRHLDLYQQPAGQARREWISARQPDWIRRLDACLPELRAALEFALTEPASTAPASTAPPARTPPART